MTKATPGGNDEHTNRTLSSNNNGKQHGMLINWCQSDTTVLNVIISPELRVARFYLIVVIAM